MLPTRETFEVIDRALAEVHALNISLELMC